MPWRLIFNCLLFAAIIILVVCITAIYYSKKVEYAVQRYSSVNVFTNLITDNIPKQLITDDSKINDVVCYSEQGDSIRMKQILNGVSKLVLYGGTSYCNSCIDYHLSQMNSLIETTGGNVILLFKYVAQRDLAIIKANHKLEISIYATNDEMGLHIETDNLPCYFIVKPDMSLTNTFYPVKEKPNYNAIYYSYIFENMVKWKKRLK